MTAPLPVQVPMHDSKNEKQIQTLLATVVLVKECWIDSKATVLATV
jgi:hypothetical protein